MQRKKLTSLRTTNYELHAVSGFTLIETLVAITLLTVAVVTPMTLTNRSLSTAYYARDQIAAFYLAQEGIEAVRAVRDGNILLNVRGTPTDTFTFPGIASIDGAVFTVDTINNSMQTCTEGECPPLKTDGEFYGYDSGWEETRFTRTVRTDFVDAVQDELRVSVTISWQTGPYQTRTFTISENIFRWLPDSTTP